MQTPRPRADAAHELTSPLADYWWVLILRGTLAILFGIAIFVWPDLSLNVLLFFVGAWFLLDGTLSLIQASIARPSWPHLFEGSLSVITALIVILYPRVTGLLLVLVMASWLLIKGVTQTALALRLRSTHRAAWLLGASGAAAVGFGACLLLDAATGALAMASLIAGFAVVFGLSSVVLGFWVER
jgi:uncharacterized membrane protein HdeD (DUF308 family)